MLNFALSLGIFGYIIFCFGLLGLLKKEILFFMSFAYLFFLLLLVFRSYFKKSNFTLPTFAFKKQWLLMTSLCFIILLALVNLVGTLGPELAFDALWYHLTFPKLYLTYENIVYIPGGLLYYATMPKLTELFYTVALSLQGETLAKLFHYGFGLATTIAIYQFGKTFTSSKFAMFGALLFYSNLVVAWESTTAYIDLSRAFFEVLSLVSFYKWIDEKKSIWFFVSSVMVGLAIATKLLAIGSIFLFLILIFVYHLTQRTTYRKMVFDSTLYLITALFIASPWFVFSYLNTNNPVYPLFTSLYPTSFELSLFSPLRFIKDVWEVFTKAADPISPVYLAVFPLVLMYYKKFAKREKYLLWYTVLAIIIWYITPRTGGGRFLLPYLPIFSITVIVLLQHLISIKKYALVYLVTLLIFVTAGISIMYRGITNSRYIPVILGTQTKADFLITHLNFSFGDFYDIDGYFKTNIESSDTVLLYGFHNLYYVDFPFTHETWVQKGTRFTHIATQNTKLPKRFASWALVYDNPVTKVKVYTNGGKEWVY